MMDPLSLIYESMQVEPEELAMGIEVEAEHTKDLEERRKIALDHLKEDPHYYTKLKKAGL